MRTTFSFMAGRISFFKLLRYGQSKVAIAAALERMPAGLRQTVPADCRIKSYHDAFRDGNRRTRLWAATASLGGVGLLSGSVIPGTGADVHFFAEGDYFDGVVTPVGSHFRRLVGQGVLAAQLFLDGGKR